MKAIVVSLHRRDDEEPVEAMHVARAAVVVLIVDALAPFAATRRR